MLCTKTYIHTIYVVARYQPMEEAYLPGMGNKDQC